MPWPILRQKNLADFGSIIGKIGKIFWLKISQNENFIMQMAYGDKKLYYKKIVLIIEKFDFLVKMPPEREVL